MVPGNIAMNATTPASIQLPPIAHTTAMMMPMTNPAV